MTVEQRIVQVPNVMNHSEFMEAVTHQTNPTVCLNPELQSFHLHVPNWKPTQAYLDSTQKSVRCDEQPADEIIIDALKRHPDATVLTVTNKACNRINNQSHPFRLTQIYLKFQSTKA